MSSKTFSIFLIVDHRLAFDVETGDFLYPIFEVESNYMTSIGASPDGKFLIIRSNANNINRIVSIGEKSPVRKMPYKVLNFPIFSRNGKYMAVITRSVPAASEFQFWDLNSQSELYKWRGMLPRDGYENPAFNSDFTQVATFGTDGYFKFVNLWSVPNFSLLKVLSQPYPNTDRGLRSFEFMSEDRLLFARAGAPEAFLFWDVQTGELVHEVTADIHASELGNPVVFSQDGRLLLVLSNDGTIHVWGVK